MAEHIELDAPKGPMPKAVKPMEVYLPDENDPHRSPFNAPNYLFEVKYDGFRAIAEIEGGEVNLYLSKPYSYNRRFPLIVDALRSIGHDVVLDGELVVFDDEGLPSFKGIQRYSGGDTTTIGYRVFDILYLDGYDLTKKPLVERKSLMNEYLSPTLQIWFVTHLIGEGIRFFDQVVKGQNLEGMVAKRIDSPYIQDTPLHPLGLPRPHHWIKIKNPDYQRR